MINPAQHKIRSIHFELSAGTEELAQQYAMRVRSINMESVLGKALHAFDSTEECIRIDRLEVELGELEGENEQAWVQSIISQVRRQLDRDINAATSKKMLPAGKKKDAKKGEGVVYLLQKEKYRLEVLVYYLRTGLLPWYVNEIIDIDELFFQLVKNDPAHVLASLREVLKSTAAKKRLAIVMEERTADELFIQILGEDGWFEMKQIVQVLQKIVHLPQAVSYRELREYILAAILNEKVDVKDILPWILGKWTPGLQTLAVEKKEKLPDQFKLEFSRTAWISESSFLLLLDFFEAQAGLQDGTTGINEQVKQSAKKSNRDNGGYSEVEEQEEDEVDDEEMRDGDVIYVDNAGMVLLNAALIRRSFENLGWTNGNEFISAQTREQALYWLHYLVHGEGKVHEYQLALNKIICGMDPSDIVDKKVNLSAEAKQEAGEVLQTIAEHWEALGNTSIPVLRESFLQRKGRLVSEDGAWHLHVESRAFDILVEKIPWTFSIIKFPWMTKPLYTQWLTRI